MDVPRADDRRSTPWDRSAKYVEEEDADGTPEKDVLDADE